MKKILGIIVLGLLLSGNAYSMDANDLADLAAKAETDYGAIVIQDYCYDEDWKMFSGGYGDDCKCAIKAGKAKSKAGAVAVLNACDL